MNFAVLFSFLIGLVVAGSFEHFPELRHRGSAIPVSHTKRLRPTGRPALQGEKEHERQVKALMDLVTMDTTSVWKKRGKMKLISRNSLNEDKEQMTEVKTPITKTYKISLSQAEKSRSRSSGGLYRVRRPEKRKTEGRMYQEKSKRKEEGSIDSTESSIKEMNIDFEEERPKIGRLKIQRVVRVNSRGNRLRNVDLRNEDKRRRGEENKGQRERTKKIRYVESGKRGRWVKKGLRDVKPWRRLKATNNKERDDTFSIGSSVQDSDHRLMDTRTLLRARTKKRRLRL